MEIKSYELSKEYSKEFINLSSMAAVLIKKPKKHVIDLFIVYPGILLISVLGVGIAFLVRQAGVENINPIIPDAFIAGLLAVIFMVSMFYAKILLTLQKGRKKERSVTYIFSETGITYLDMDSDPLETKWEDFSSLIILEKGMYFIPDSNKGVLIGIQKEGNEEKVRDFLSENDIGLEIVEQ